LVFSFCHRQARLTDRNAITTMPSNCTPRTLSSFRRTRLALAAAALMLILTGLACGPVVGIVSPDRIDSRMLELWNRSQGYVVFRVSAPGAHSLVTPVLPPGGEYNTEIKALFGTLCPDGLTVEIFAYARANPQADPFDDPAVTATPFASAVVEMLPGRDYGCHADVDLVSLDDTISCDVFDANESAADLGFDLNGTLQVCRGLNADDPPTPELAHTFALRGRVVNRKDEPIPNAKIHFLDFDWIVLTDSDGRFAVPLPEGSYLIEAVVVGVEVTPSVRRFSHRDTSELPIEFIAQTDDVPPLAAGTED
jgi:hypothetical protein